MQWVTPLVMKMLSIRFAIHIVFLISGLLLSACVTTTRPLQNQSQTPEVLYQQGVVRYQAGDTTAARQLFLKAVQVDSSYADAYRGLSGIAFDQGAFRQSDTYLRKHLALQSNPEPIIWHRLGQIGWELQDYEQAIEGFQTYLELKPAKSRLIPAAEKYLRDSRFLQRQDSIESRKDMPLSSAINTTAGEYLPSLPADGASMIFTRRVHRQEDFYVAKRIDGVWQNAEPLSELNTPDNEGAHFLSADGRMLLFTRCGVQEDYGSCDLYFTTTDGISWQTPRNLGPQVNTNAWESQPCLSADGRRLFFSSNRAGGVGGRDIWYLNRTTNGWSSAINLTIVNTAGNDESPYLHPDGHSLYFMSDGHPGHGGYDLYYHNLTGDSNVLNLGGAVNTEEDEGAMSISLDGRTGYFARTVVDDPSRLNIDIFEVPLPQRVHATPSIYAALEIYDEISKERIDGRANIFDLQEEQSTVAYTVSATGQNLITLSAGKDYGLRIDKPGYTFYSEHIDLRGPVSRLDPIQVKISLSPIREISEASEPIILRNIFFETGSAALLDASFAELDFLKSKMDKNPEMKIMIQGHTDDVGSPTDNLRLSQERAKSVYDYLVAAGVAVNRMRSRGFGEDQPLVPNVSEDDRSKNRRTEFVIVDSF